MKIINKTGKLFLLIIFLYKPIDARLLNVQISLDEKESLEKEEAVISYGAAYALCQKSSILVVTSNIFYNIIKIKALPESILNSTENQIDIDSEYYIYRTKQFKDFYLFIPKSYKKQIYNQYNTVEFKKAAAKYEMHKPEEILVGFKTHPTSNILEKVTIAEFDTEEKINSIAHDYDSINLESFFQMFTTGLDEIFALYNFLLDGHGIYPKNLTTNLTINEVINAVVGSKSYIVGLKIDQFRELIKFFINLIKVNFLYYSSCFAGDLNLILPYVKALEYSSGRIISSIKNPKFIIAVGSISSVPVAGPKISVLKNCTTMSDQIIDYKSFFAALDKYSNPETNKPTLFSKKELQEILTPITPRKRFTDDPYGISALPSVMYPNSDQFLAIPLSEKIAVVSNVLVRQRELETDEKKRPIILQDKEVILIYPNKINVDVIINKADSQKYPPTLVSMIPGESIIEFDTIKTNINLYDFILGSIGSVHTAFQKYFYIKKLKIKNSTTNMELNHILISSKTVKNVVNLNVIYTDQNELIRTYHTHNGRATSQKLNDFVNIIRNNEFLNAILNYFYIFNYKEVKKNFNFESLKKLLSTEDLENLKNKNNQYLLRSFHDIKQNPNQLSAAGDIALNIAAANDNVDLMNNIINWGGLINNKDQHGNTPLIIAAYFNSANVFNLLLNYPDINIFAQNNNHQNAIQLAKAMKNTEILEIIINRLLPKKLVNQYPNLLTAQEQLNMALFSAIQFYVLSVHVLISLGANVNMVVPKNNITPLMQAIFFGKSEVAKLLLNNGANAFAKDALGNNSMYYAKKYNHLDILNMIKEKLVNSNAVIP